VVSRSRSADGETETLPLLRHELWQSEATAMVSVIFEVHPKQETFDLYLDLAKGLKPILEGIVGFIDNERFESTRRPGWILSHSTWRDEKSVVRWRTVAKHHDTQQRGRDEVFQDYHLRVGEIVADTAPPAGASIVEQRLDETEIGRAKYVTLTEVQHPSGVSAAALPHWLGLDQEQADLIDHDVFASIYNMGKFALLASWRDRLAAERFNPLSRTGVAGARHRIVPGVYLGRSVDAELDGQPNATATGDDLGGTNDEDGVTFVSPLQIGQTATVSVVASVNGFLDAWIDFNGNGTDGTPLTQANLN